MNENKCKSYSERIVKRQMLDPWWYSLEQVEGCCLDTKEMDSCSCGGDPMKCDFYPEKRIAAEKSTKEQTYNLTTIYYAHHQWKYGTKVEEYELELIKRYFPNAKIFNPSVDLTCTKEDGEEAVMNECLEIVKNSDILIFSSLDGCIGTGVYHEIKEAKKNDKLVLYIFHDTLLTDFDIIKRSPFEETDRLYATVRINHF